MQIFILHYYRAIPFIRCLRIYTKNDNNMATVSFYTGLNTKCGMNEM